jgi:hypothetical protein
LLFLLGGAEAQASSPLCYSSGDIHSYEWVTRVKIDTGTSYLGAVGYTDGTATPIADLVAGQTYPIEVDVHTDGSTYEEFVKVWFDLNQNGAIEDPAELVFEQGKDVTSFATFSGTFTVPATAYNGQVYLRTIMQYSSTPELCGTYTFGQTEDYLVNVTGGVNNPGASLAADGTACEAGEACESGFCIDGVCCSSACGGGGASDCEACDVAGSLGSCVALAAGTLCRASLGVCDVAESCDGESTGCPPDGFLPSSVLCRPSAGICDVAETCSGESALCPWDGFVPATEICRASAGVCDAVERCTGASAACPEDGFAPPSQVCRASEGVCDAVETCTGESVLCPADGFAPPSQVCRASAGICDVPETCTGLGVACPADAFAPSTLICRLPACAEGTSSLVATCSGEGVVCPKSETLFCGAFACGQAACLQACAVEADCAPGRYCHAGSCEHKAPQGGACSSDLQCGTGFCVDGVCCDSACDGQCQACDAPDSVGTCAPVKGAPHGQRPACAGDGSKCSGTCDGQDVSSCAVPDESVVCREASCAAFVAVKAAACDGHGACPALEIQACAPFLCGGLACAGDCAVDSDCQLGNFCNAGVCVEKRAPGKQCWGKNQCATGQCVDGVCCNSACNGQCEACDLPELAGTCSPVSGAPHNLRPACVGEGTLCGGTCDGQNPTTCAYPGAKVICRAGSCTEGVAVLEAGCDGVGLCPVEQKQGCGEFACGAKLCLAGCTHDAECQSGSYCSAGVCAAKQANGASCGGANQCASDFCVDGVCCNLACNGQCEACDITGKAGACMPILGAPHGGREACNGALGSMCGGQCNGLDTQACAYPSASVTCRAADCDGGMATMPAFCNGAGACPGMEQQPCGQYACGNAACMGDCADDGQCAAGHFCSVGICQPKHLLGLGCNAAADCQSGQCVDGVCCNAACDGQCEACDVEGSVGTCAPTKGLPHGGRAACAGQGACTSTCDGTTVDACVFPAAGTACGAESCQDGALAPASTCDGAGICRAGEPSSCGAYACEQAACATICASDAQCAEGYVCALTLCVPPHPASCSLGQPADDERPLAPVLFGLGALLVISRRRRS